MLEWGENCSGVVNIHAESLNSLQTFHSISLENRQVFLLQACTSCQFSCLLRERKFQLMQTFCIGAFNQLPSVQSLLILLPSTICLLILSLLSGVVSGKLSPTSSVVSFSNILGWIFSCLFYSLTNSHLFSKICWNLSIKDDLPCSPHSVHFDGFIPFCSSILFL